MPTGLKRFQQGGGSHFLTFSCYGRLPYFSDPAACRIFEHALEMTRRRYVFHVFGYVIMPEHVHLLVSEPRLETLARAIQGLKTSVSKQCRQQPFWLARYYDFNINTEDKRIEKLRYVHRNPVKRGLVAHCEDWKWSSFRHYLSGKKGVVLIESPWTAAERLGLRLRAEVSAGDPP
jgi:putative transposase